MPWITCALLFCLLYMGAECRNEVLDLDLQMIAYLAELGKLRFTEDEMEKMAAEMTSIIGIMDTVKEIDVEYDAYADNKNVYLYDLREDVKEPSFPTEKILQNSVHDENCFVVPKVVE